MKINEFQENVLSFEFKEEIKKLVNDINGFLNYYVEQADENEVIVYKRLSEDKKLVIEIRKINVKKEFGVDGRLTIVELTLLSPQGFYMNNTTVIVSSSEVSDEIINIIPCSYRCIKNKNDSELLDNLDKLIKRFNKKKNTDDSEREYELLSNLFKNINN